MSTSCSSSADEPPYMSLCTCRAQEVRPKGVTQTCQEIDLRCVTVTESRPGEITGVLCASMCICQSVACHLMTTVAAPGEDQLTGHLVSQTASWITPNGPLSRAFVLTVTMSQCEIKFPQEFTLNPIIVCLK